MLGISFGESFPSSLFAPYLIIAAKADRIVELSQHVREIHTEAGPFPGVDDLRVSA